MALVVLAGPAGVGKGTIVQRILASEPDFMLSVSATTRSPRPGEVDGVHYHFISKVEFEGLIAENQLLEHAIVHGSNYYGTPLNELTRAEAEDKHLLLEIDLQGARQVKARIPQALTIFISPPSWEELESRLRNRGTETEEQIQTRLSTARTELASAGEFDFNLTNQDLDSCVAQVVELVRKYERGS
ncbi:guanylate kinase [Aquiluna sp. KACHI24]|uniref:guanylate kinase n=1 Tax=Aquiluna sp. KACHI24 TaxID=2968831 RepID=UPI00220E7200|nr:guanylate kinase [Aquiluna sp. KACHI24]BDQ00295.1 guanylate kinase [Aquiluna sp. KACHI24]